VWGRELDVTGLCVMTGFFKRSYVTQGDTLTTRGSPDCTHLIDLSQSYGRIRPAGPDEDVVVMVTGVLMPCFAARRPLRRRYRWSS
jgi:hypothetical protein